jgi:TPR repeat protein
MATGWDDFDFQLESHYQLAFHLQSGCGVAQDEKEAAWHFRQAAVWGHLEGEFEYGLCLEKGKGVKKDLKTAAEFLRSFAERCLSKNLDLKLKREGEECLGECEGNKVVQDMYKYGCGLLRDRKHGANLKKGAKFLKMSADGGYRPAWYQYGLCLQRGLGVRKNLKAALRYYKMFKVDD